ncbi:unnamed protein product [Triticum turgidum subsp. durum]|uniref:DUF4220 domain-containing protein n=1 Tax=Triticum turgidum subsp. durum TaxID=4567 RepID=A0A9R1PB12_TRITD|nr:unnamed protein product [Triticum turgidum subsp. durum]
MAEGPLDFWINWGSQIGVLLSLAFQVILHLFANVRRRSSSAMLRVPLWLAYQLSDMTAIYAAGQLLYSSNTPQDHQLIALWAPFLLLHLGGPDNITAYALEDSKLWKRHLLILAVQVAGAGYVLYKYIAGSGILLTLAAILILVIGVAKYGERTWALRAANFSILQSSIKATKEKSKTKSSLMTSKEETKSKSSLKVPRRDQYFYQEWYNDLPDELILQRAHSLFHICKRGIVDSVVEIDVAGTPSKVTIQELKNDHEKMWRVMEMELSLMYDILYTKANVIHSWFGYCIRTISPLTVIASLMLFRLSNKDGYSRVDIAITYTLLGGALVLETKSLLGALGSSWALGFLCATRLDWLRHSSLCTGRWYRLRRTLLSLRRSWPGKMIMTGGSRRWSGIIGQHNMLRFCAGQVDPMSRRLENLFMVLGLGEWWDRRYYSCTVVVPKNVMKCAQKVGRWSQDDINTMGVLRHKWGEAALDNRVYHELYKELEKYHGVEFHESIICWHIATDLILARVEKEKGHFAADSSAQIVRALSNYMMFLLVNSPYMLPGLPQNCLYKQTCNNLDKICDDYNLVGSLGDNLWTVLKKLLGLHHHRVLESSGLEKKLADVILELPKGHAGSGSETPRLLYARRIAVLILESEVVDDKVRLLLDLWIDFLAYAANRCIRESHAKKLSTGGELMTIVWLILEHLRYLKEDPNKEGSHV